MHMNATAEYPIAVSEKYFSYCRNYFLHCRLKFQNLLEEDSYEEMERNAEHFSKVSWQ
jgi:hypothetical protein